MEPNDTLLTIMTAAVVISAVALLAQALMVFGMFRSIQALRQQVTNFLPKAESFLSVSEKTLADSQAQVKEVAHRAMTILDTTHKQLVRVDGFLEDATTRARVQIDRVEMVLDDTVTRLHETVVQLNNGVLKPVREINGLASGLRAAFHHLIRGNRPNVASATSDEEMFI